MSRTKVNLKDPVLAAIFAFLVPGMGHFYQRRVFKGVLYCVCILGTFFGGLSIGHGQVVYFQWRQPESRTYAYLCQFWVGLPALPALAQSQLRSKEAFDVNHLSGELKSDFEGVLNDTAAFDKKPIGRVIGTLTLKPPADRPQHGSWTGHFEGLLTTDQGKEKIEGDVHPGRLEAEVAPWRERRLSAHFDGVFADRPEESVRGKLEGAIPRPIWNVLEAPLQDPKPSEIGGEATDLDRAHRELGGRFELGVVYTMIAGLLNILAIYDALEGPAYEDDEDETKADKPPPSEAPAAA